MKSQAFLKLREFNSEFEKCDKWNLIQINFDFISLCFIYILERHLINL